MSRPQIGDTDNNYVRMSLADFGEVATVLKAAGYTMVVGRRNGRGPAKLHRLAKVAATVTNDRVGVLHCLQCRKRATPLNGIYTTKGFFCYDCVKVIHAIADETKALRENPAAKQEMDQES